MLLTIFGFSVPELGILCLLGNLVAGGTIVFILWYVLRKPQEAQPTAPRSKRCPACGIYLSPDAPKGLCPACLLKQGLSDDYDEVLPTDSPKRRSTPVGPQPDGQRTAQYAGTFTAPSIEDLAARFPQLEIVELLGQGGMGAVYKARQPKLDRLVALKILPPEANDPAFAERFMREARTLARLDHPGIVRVHDFGESGGLHYFIMEYVDGANLRQLLRSGELRAEQTLKIVPQICDALQFAHDEGIIHRDIKPENILMDRKGRVKIADFGLAKILGRVPGDLSLTGTHQVMGTPHYMAPEQIERPLSVDHRADVYALGVVFYEMLTGELPLGQFSVPSQKSGSDVRLDAAVLRALAREPERRFQSAGEMKRAMEAVRAEKPEDPNVLPTARVAAPEVALSPEKRLGTASVPFTIDNIMGGLAEATGLMRIERGELILEYQKVFLSMIRFGFVENRIALGDVQSMRWDRGWFKDSITIRATHLKALSEVSGSHMGEVTLETAKKDIQLVEDLLGRLSGVVPVESTEPSRSETRMPALAGRGITITAILLGLIGVAIAFLPFIPWATLSVKACDIDHRKVGPMPNPVTASWLQLQYRTFRSFPGPNTMPVAEFYGQALPEGIFIGVVLLILALFLIATFGIRRFPLLRPLAILIGGAAVTIGALACQEYIPRSHSSSVSLQNPSSKVELNGKVVAGTYRGVTFCDHSGVPFIGPKGEKISFQPLEHKGTLALYVMHQSVSGTMIVPVPNAKPKAEEEPIFLGFCNIKGTEFILPLGSQVDGMQYYDDFARELGHALEVKAGAGIYLAQVLGVILLFLGAGQFLLVLSSSRNEEAAANREPAKRLGQAFIPTQSRSSLDTPPTQVKPGKVRSFVHALYSLMFVSRARETPSEINPVDQKSDQV